MGSDKHRSSHSHRANRRLKNGLLKAIHESPSYRWEWIWSCCSCGIQGGMTTFIEQCPGVNCGHTRCHHCSTEAVKIRNGGSRCSGATSTSKPVQYNHPELKVHAQTANTSSSIWEEDPVPTTSSKIGSSKATNVSSISTTFSKIVPAEATSTTPTKSAVLPLRPCPTVMPVLKSQNESVFSTPARSLLPTPKSTSTPRSGRSSSTFSPRMGQVDDSATELDSEITDSDSDDLDDFETDDGGIDNLVRILDSRLLSALSCNLDLAARLIPKIHHLFNGGKDVLGGKFAGSNCRNGTNEQQENESTNYEATSGGSSSAPIDQNLPPSSRLRKHGRDSGDNYGGRKDNNSKKPRGDPDGSPDDDPSPAGSTGGLPDFACHFHKLDPTKYGPWTDRKYKQCTGSSITELRRIKYHFKAAHRSPQCNRCYLVFQNANELKDHQQERVACSKGPPILKEGIDDGQWEEIERVLSSKKGQKQVNDITRWFAVWQILFPGVAEPSNPWNEPPGHAVHSAYNVDDLVLKVKRKLQPHIEDGILQCGHQVHDIYLNAFRQALEEDNATRGAVKLRSPSTPPYEDFTQMTSSDLGKLPLLAENNPLLLLQESETTLIPDMSKVVNSHTSEELGGQSHHLGSWTSPPPSSSNLSTTRLGPFIHNETISLPMMPLPETVLALTDKCTGEPNLAPTQTAHDFIENDFDFEAVDLMRSSALSYPESNMPREDDTLQDNCHPDLDYFMDDELFLKHLGREIDDVHFVWKDKDSGNRALRGP